MRRGAKRSGVGRLRSGESGKEAEGLAAGLAAGEWRGWTGQGLWRAGRRMLLRDRSGLAGGGCFCRLLLGVATAACYWGLLLRVATRGCLSRSMESRVRTGQSRLSRGRRTPTTSPGPAPRWLEKSRQRGRTDGERNADVGCGEVRCGDDAGKSRGSEAGARKRRRREEGEERKRSGEAVSGVVGGGRRTRRRTGPGAARGWAGRRAAAARSAPVGGQRPAPVWRTCVRFLVG